MYYQWKRLHKRAHHHYPNNCDSPAVNMTSRWKASYSGPAFSAPAFSTMHLWNGPASSDPHFSPTFSASLTHYIQSEALHCTADVDVVVRLCCSTRRNDLGYSCWFSQFVKYRPRDVLLCTLSRSFCVKRRESSHILTCTRNIDWQSWMFTAENNARIFPFNSSRTSVYEFERFHTTLHRCLQSKVYTFYEWYN